MLDLLLVPLAIVYLVVLGVLFAYGVNFFYLAFLAQRRRPDEGEGNGRPQLSQWPRVTVQLPIYNELYVAERVIEAAANLDYPSELLQIQVLDDSTDETRAIVRRAVDRQRARGVNISILSRQNREGYKAGALQAGLRSADGEYVAIFDSDFVPTSDYLKRVIPVFKPDTAFVQARWGHLNRDYSLLTYLQSLAIDAHFAVEQFARWAGDLWFNFNGTAGTWRRRALEDAGGWQADTLTEDLDISYRALLRGWRARFARDVVVPAELPVSMIAFRRQQHRWARGSLECALKLGPLVWTSTATLRVKLSATLHLTGYAVHLFLFALSLLYPLILVVGQRYPQIITIFGLAVVFNITALAPSYFFMVGQNQIGRSWWRSLPHILFITAVGSGLMINTVRAALQMLTRKQNAFERTAKFGIKEKRQSWMSKRYQLRLDPIVYWELGFVALNLLTASYSIWLGNLPFALYAMIFAVGLLYVSGLTIFQAIAVFWQQRKHRLIDAAGLAMRFEREIVDSGD